MNLPHKKTLLCHSPQAGNPGKGQLEQTLVERKKKKTKLGGREGGWPNTSLEVFLQVASVSKLLVSFTTEYVAVHSPLRFSDLELIAGLYTDARQRALAVRRPAKHPGWIQLQL